jgi:hypothetical protein
METHFYVCKAIPFYTNIYFTTHKSTNIFNRFKLWEMMIYKSSYLFKEDYSITLVLLIIAWFLMPTFYYPYIYQAI